MLFKSTQISSYKQEFLAKYFCHESHNAHDVDDDVNMLAKIVCTFGMENLDYVKHKHLIVTFYRKNLILLRRKILIFFTALI